MPRLRIVNVTRWPLVRVKRALGGFVGLQGRWWWVVVGLSRERRTLTRPARSAEGAWVVPRRLVWRGGASGAPNAPWWVGGVSHGRQGEWWQVARRGLHFHQICSVGTCIWVRAKVRASSAIKITLVAAQGVGAGLLLQPPPHRRRPAQPSQLNATRAHTQAPRNAHSCFRVAAPAKLHELAPLCRREVVAALDSAAEHKGDESLSVEPGHVEVSRVSRRRGAR